MELVELFGRGVDAFTARVRSVEPDQWTAATPLPGWDVRTLVNHVVGEQLWMPPMFEGATIAEVGDRFEGDVLGADPLATAQRTAAAAKASVAPGDALDRTVHLSFGDTPAKEYLRQLLADHVVHGWDLAVAIGADRSADPEVVHEVAVWFTDRESGYRASGAIGPRMVPDDPTASELDRLIAAFGRDPGTGSAA